MDLNDPVTVLNAATAPQFSICTLVTRPAEYEEMRRSFLERGFTDDIVEYLIVDNSQGNRADAYTAVNAFLQRARAPYIIICHQDVLLIADGIEALRARIREVEAIDSCWAVLGNAGSTPDGKLAIRISDPVATDQHPGNLPARANALDENFLTIRRDANLAVSRDLAGFHHYGYDLCIIADILGWSAWVIDFHLLHKSKGSFDSSFRQSKRALSEKYSRALRPRWVYGVVQSPVYITASPLLRRKAQLVYIYRKSLSRLRARLGLGKSRKTAFN